MTDQKILELLNQRNEKALTVVQEQYGRYCYSVAYNVLGSKEDAEECVNDTLIRVWNAIPPAQPKSIGAYAAAATRNIAKNRWKSMHAQRRSGTEADLALEELVISPEAPDNVEHEADSRALGEGLNRFLSLLPQKQRIIFVQRYWYFMQVDDIAADLGIPKSTVTVTLVRLRKKLRDYLEKEGLL